MNNLFDQLDKYKFGIIITMAVLIGVYIYLMLDSFPKGYIEYEPFHRASHVEIPPEEIMLQPQNIMLPADFKPEDVKNMTRDANDSRERSFENYYENQSTPQSIAEAEQAVYDLEQQMKDATGGQEARDAIRDELAARKARLEQTKQNPSNNRPTNQNTGNTAYAGSVMVEFDVPKHTAHQNNNWYVRNPGYTCPKGSSGTVTIVVKVSQSGSVTSATFDPSRSSGANSCMIEQAKKYAKISRFNFAKDAASSQTGWISYRFISS